MTDKKIKNWMTLALGVGIAAKGAFDLLNDEEDIEDIELSEGGKALKEEIEGKSKYSNMDIEEAKIAEKGEEDKNESEDSSK